MEGTGSQDRHNSQVGIVLSGSHDVRRSVGQDDMLANRLAGARRDAPEVRTTLSRGWRCDVLDARLRSEAAPIEAPAEVRAWLDDELRTPEIAPDTVLLVMSMAPAVTADVRRHRGTGCLVQLPADHRERWAPATLEWLDREFDPEPADMARLTSSLSSLAHHLASADIELVIYNISSFVPDERTFWFRDGDPDPASITAARLNLMLDSLPADLGVTVISLDRITAEFGAADAVVGVGEYSETANAAIAEEVAERVMELPRISAQFSPDVMRLAIPRYDRRTDDGVLEEWHISSNTEFKAGDPLFDVRFVDLHTRVNAAVKRKSQRALRVSVVASRDGFLLQATLAAGDSVTAGATVGIVTTDPSQPVRDTEDVARFPVGLRLVTQ